ncbi:MAG: hypothetical protein NC395_01790, partial [Prevotella sp.]|nr:hypothetical protein [Prevotella sp.]
HCVMFSRGERPAIEGVPLGMRQSNSPKRPGGTFWTEQTYSDVLETQHNFVALKTVHRTVFKSYCAAYCQKGERSCPLPLGMAVAIPHPLPRFGRICAYGARRISPSAEGDQRALPFGNSQP